MIRQRTVVKAPSPPRPKIEIKPIEERPQVKRAIPEWPRSRVHKCQWPLWGHGERSNGCYCDEFVVLRPRQISVGDKAMWSHVEEPFCAEHYAMAHVETQPASKLGELF